MTDTLRRLMRTPQGVLGSVLLAGLVLACILGSTAAPYQPEAMDFAGRFAAPGVKHWFGADQLGRDVLSRLLVGARSTIPLPSPPPFRARRPAPASALCPPISAPGARRRSPGPST